MDVPPSSDTREKKDVALNAKKHAAITHTDSAAFRELALFERRHALGCKEHCYRHFGVLTAGCTQEKTEQCKTRSKHTVARGASSKPNRLGLITYMYLWSNLPSEPMSKMQYAMRKILVTYLVEPCAAMP